MENTNNQESNAITHKDKSLTRLDLSVNKHIVAKEYKKSHLLSYWFEDFANYHDNEKSFRDAKMRTFKRGDIIKVNLGFNVGNELGGLHYCIVLNKIDRKTSGNLNVIPLTSFYEGKTINKYTSVHLGNELYDCINKKIDILKEEIGNNTKSIIDIPNIKKLNNVELLRISQKLEHLTKTEEELDKMKTGSIALVNQITTISKQRIFLTPVLYNVKISKESLDLIDNKIVEIFTKK